MPLIAIIDDRATNLAIYARLARAAQADAAVEVFKEPMSALAWIAENDADLIITDYKMPGMTGAEFTRAVRLLPTSVDVPIVVITAYSDKTFRLDALEAGATDFLESPVDHAEFTTRVRNLLKMSWQHKVIRDRAIVLERELSTTRLSHDEVIRESRERLAQVIDTVPALVSASDVDGVCIFMNAHLLRVAGLGPSAHRTARPEPFGPAHAAASRARDAEVMRTGRAAPSFEEMIRTASGADLTLLTTKTPLRDAAGEVTGVLTTSTDITERILAEQRLLFFANHDYLTSLPNRPYLHDRLQQALAASRPGSRGFALHLIDLDQFKSVNDGLGHHYGDRLLKIVAARLKEAIGPADLVARIGGDEFAILQAGTQQLADATSLAVRIIEALRAPIKLDEHEVIIGASVGITLHPESGADPDQLLQNADLAMYRAKLAGRNGFAVFSAHMLAEAKDMIALQGALQKALPQNEFSVHYQPQVNLKTGEIIGAEALLRWSRPGWGLLTPADFLPVAEQTGLILAANEWVLHEVCERAAGWAAAGLPIRVAVNLSPLQFKRCNICDLVFGALERSGLSPQHLELELTENILIEHGDSATAQLSELHGRGICISIDDFGIGYSSLTRLMGLRVDRLKIDRSFVGDLTDTSKDTAIVRAIVALGHALKLEVLAEGVETADQLRRLRHEGCDSAQGYHFARPMPAADFERLLRTWSPEAVLGQAGEVRAA
jgi:diguanylate cyclase (GGDEF)-like protein/PAS domain S-box-containing protein